MGELLARLRGLSPRNKAIAAVGVVGAAGLGLLARARGAGLGVDTGQAESSAGATGEATYTPPGTYPNTYGTDLASALGEIDSRYAEDLAEFVAGQGTTAAALAAMQKSQGKTLADINKKVAGLTAPPTKSKLETKPKTKDPKKAAAKPKPSAFKTYTIKRGDTLGAIAKHYHTSVGALVKANKIANPNKIVAGAKLKVPA